MLRRTFLALPAAAAATATWAARQWKIDPRCVLPRGPAGAFDSKVVGDPSIVWDEEVNTWRMFYFASSHDDPTPGRAEALVAGMALAKSAEEIGPVDWRKVGQVPLANSNDLFAGRPGHKWWVAMDPLHSNRAAQVNGRYWALFVSTAGVKHIQVAWASRLAGPWTVIRQPILSPGKEEFAPDGKHCDTPTAYWFAERGAFLIFYKAYPERAQKGQPGSPFGSSSVAAWWKPGEALAAKGAQVLIPGRGKQWNRGWAGGLQLLSDPAGGWYGLSNGSPTPPEDLSHREPAPSLAGWVTCRSRVPDQGWDTDMAHSPFRYPSDLTALELKAGLGVNFWRHHLLATPGGQARIFFNSGQYGTEQMYSMLPA
jgi:hypothetical protein